MTEDELDRIKKSFVRSSDECPMEVACLLTVMKYYGGQQDARTLAEWCKVDGKYTLMGMKQAAIRAGMEADFRFHSCTYSCRNGSGNLLAKHGTIVHQKISCHTFCHQ